MNALTEAQDTSLGERRISSSVIQRALHPLDILTLLFDFCSNGTLASLARVCRSWSNEALQHLWRQLEDPLPLLQLLGSLEENPNGWNYVSP